MISFQTGSLVLVLPFLNLLPKSKGFLPAAGFCSNWLQILVKICATSRKVFKVPIRGCSNFNDFFGLQYPISSNNGETKTFIWREKNLVGKKVPHNGKIWILEEFCNHHTPADHQLQLELLSSLQNSIIYHRTDIVKSAWIHPWYCIQITIKWICKIF